MKSFNTIRLFGCFAIASTFALAGCFAEPGGDEEDAEDIATSQDELIDLADRDSQFGIASVQNQDFGNCTQVASGTVLNAPAIAPVTTQVDTLSNLLNLVGGNANSGNVTAPDNEAESNFNVCNEIASIKGH